MSIKHWHATVNVHKYVDICLQHGIRYIKDIPIHDYNTLAAILYIRFEYVRKKNINIGNK